MVRLSQERRQKNQETLGSRLKSYRTREGFTQKALADALGIEYYTMISQMELGYISIPPSFWGPIADTLKIDRATWILDCLYETNPEIYNALFRMKSRAEVAVMLDKLRKGELDDESDGNEDCSLPS